MSLINDSNTEAMNGSYGALFRKNLTSDLTARLDVCAASSTRRIRLQQRRVGRAVRREGRLHAEQHEHEPDRDVEQPVRSRTSGSSPARSSTTRASTSSTATYRYDGSSLFGAGNRWAPFGRVSGVWRVSEESFWKVPHITDFRLRASHGTAGNTPSFNAQYETYNCGTTGCSLGQAGNRNLKPETTTETELGTDFTLFNRLGVELTKADSKTKNQILNVPTPSTLGFTNQWQNAGTLANHTWELAVNLPVITRA